MEDGLPAEFAFDSVRAGDEDSRVARPACARLDGNVAACDRLCRLNHFEHAVAFAAATEIIDRTSLIQHRERENVRARKVNYMDVIAYARAVARRVVVAVDGDVRAHACGGLQDDRDQMCFRVVRLTTQLGRARRVEVTQ